MKTGKITAKLRDAVPVCLMVEDTEVKRYKNIELPDAIKEIELKDFRFHIPEDGKITFRIFYEAGALPEVFPAPRAKMTRAEKAAAKAAAKASEEETALAIIPENPNPTEAVTAEIETAEEITENAESMADEAANTETEMPEETAVAETEGGNMEIHYNVNGPRRKELAAAVGDFIGAKPKYMRAPTYAFEVGDYTIGRDGTLTGKSNSELVKTLAAQGFIAA